MISLLRLNSPNISLTPPFAAQAHGRPSLRSLAQAWNDLLQKELEHKRTVKTDAAAAFLASLEDPKLTTLGEAPKKPPIEILPPGMPSLSAPPLGIKKPGSGPTPLSLNQSQPTKPPLMLEAPSTATPTATPGEEQSNSNSVSNSAAPKDGAEAPPQETPQAPAVPTEGLQIPDLTADSSQTAEDSATNIPQIPKDFSETSQSLKEGMDTPQTLTEALTSSPSSTEPAAL